MVRIPTDSAFPNLHPSETIFVTETRLLMTPEWVRPNKLDDCQAKSFVPHTTRLTVSKLCDTKQNWWPTAPHVTHPVIPLNNISNFISYITANTLNLQYKDQHVKLLSEIIVLYSENHIQEIYNTRVKEGVCFILKHRVCSKQCALKG